MQKAQLQLQGMACAACAANIEQAINQVVGIETCSVNFALSQAWVTFDSKRTNLGAIQEVIQDAGYLAWPLPQPGEDGDEIERQSRRVEQQDLQRKVIFSGVVSVLLVVGSLPMMLGIPVAWIPPWLCYPGRTGTRCPDSECAGG